MYLPRPGSKGAMGQRISEEYLDVAFHPAPKGAGFPGGLDKIHQGTTLPAITSMGTGNFMIALREELLISSTSKTRRSGLRS